MKLSFFDLYLFWVYKYLNKLPMYSISKRNEQKIRDSVLRYGLSNINTEGLICEFGVHKGISINLIAEKLTNHQIYGFDSFEGFPEDGRTDWQQDFKTSIPTVKNNVNLIVGFFDNTLDKFLKEKNSNVAFAHIDCDIYSSTKTIFDCFAKHHSLTNGSVIVFDELINYKTALWNELLALYRYLFKQNFDIEWLCVHQAVENIDETLLFYKNNTYPSNTILRGDGKYWRQQAACKIKTTGIDYSEINNSEVYKKIKFYSREFQKYIKELKLNCFTNEDFIEQYTIKESSIVKIKDNGSYIYIYELKEIPATIPFMTNAITMPYPEKFIMEFLKEQKFVPSTIIEIGGGKKFNLYDKFKKASYINIDFSENTGIPTKVKNIVTDDFNDLKESADLIYTNNTFEHIYNPYIAAQNMISMLKKDGYLFVRAPFAYRYHPVPNDYWRFSPDGLACLFSSLKCIKKGLDNHTRRANHLGSFANKLDLVPQDKLGGWQEIWFSYFIGQKK